MVRTFFIAVAVAALGACGMVKVQGLGSGSDTSSSRQASASEASSSSQTTSASGAPPTAPSPEDFRCDSFEGKTCDWYLQIPSTRYHQALTSWGMDSASVWDLENFDQTLAALQKKHAEGTACTRCVAGEAERLAGPAEAMAQRIAQAEQNRPVIVRYHELRERAYALANQLRAFKGGDLAPIDAELAALRKELDDFASSHGEQYRPFAELPQVLSVAEDARKGAGSVVAHQERAALKKEIESRLVVERLSGYTLEDSFDLEKIEQAMRDAPADLFVRVAEIDTSYNARAHNFRPTGDPKHDGHHNLDRSKQWAVVWHNNDVELQTGYHDELAPGTPALLWAKDGGAHVLVTADGGRYWSKVDAFQQNNKPRKLSVEPGLAPASEWPAPLQHTALFAGDIERLEARGELAKGTLAKINRAKEAGKACAERIWKAAEPRFARIRTDNITYSTRQNRLLTLRLATEKKQKSACKQHIAAVERIVEQAIAKRSAQRKAIYERIRPHLESLAE